MRSSNKKRIICASIILAGALAIVLWRHPFEYYYYLWALNRSTAGNDIEHYQDAIVGISAYIKPSLLSTYENDDASRRSRHAAALGLIKVDAATADTIFAQYLSSTDSDRLREAIFHLAIAKSESVFTSISSLKSHGSAKVRSSVAYYLGNIPRNESVVILREMMEKDPDQKVRDAAIYGLQELGTLPRK